MEVEARKKALAKKPDAILKEWTVLRSHPWPSLVASGWPIFTLFHMVADGAFAAHFPAARHRTNATARGEAYARTAAALARRAFDGAACRAGRWALAAAQAP